MRPGPARGMNSDMERTTLHIVCGDSRSRAEQARIAFALGHHAEVYAGLDELLDRPPHEGIVIAAPEPATEQVVAAIKAGALDYLRLPLEMGSFARSLHAILTEAGQHAERRRREVEAQRAIALLSRREREVLELLAAGCSNKEIARRLDISPRTVEIHRGNMMTKLHAGHAADAVRLWIDAQLDIPALPAEDDAVVDVQEGISGRIGERRRNEREALARRRQRQ